MEAKLKAIVDRLKLAAGENLQAVALYGSAVTGEFIAKHSDLNIMCIVKRASATELEKSARRRGMVDSRRPLGAARFHIR